MTAPLCRLCAAPLHHTFVDLGVSPLSNSYVEPSGLAAAETFYPLHARVCGSCFLVQVEQFEAPARIFGDYAYFSSYSESWLAHARAYVEAMMARRPFTADHLVVEIASNDGYLLQYFRERGIPVLGFEPAANVAAEAAARGIPSRVEFFGLAAARALQGEGRLADLLIGNNVLAHVPDLNDFASGLKAALKPDGLITMEFPHLLQLMRNNQFDTIYHEHFSYFSCLTVQRLFAKHGLALVDVEELPTHGGSLRIHAVHAERPHAVAGSVAALIERERAEGLATLSTYDAFAGQVRETKRALLDFLIRVKREGKSVVAYGAPAKGNTLLNYCGIRGDFIDYTVDRSPHKQGKYLPGSRIPVFAPDKLSETRPDYVLILPWNIRDEIVEQLEHVRAWGGRFVVPIPAVEVF